MSQFSPILTSRRMLRVPHFGTLLRIERALPGSSRIVEYRRLAATPRVRQAPELTPIPLADVAPATRG